MKAQTQRKVRQFHHYLGVFFAPAILFFAFTGAFQTFRLQEVKGWGGPPPQWLVWTASLHRNQEAPRPKAEKPAANGPAKVEAPKGEVGKSKLPLQVFTVVMSLGLMFSTLLGVVLALNNRPMRRVSVVMLVLGTALPLLMV